MPTWDLVGHTADALENRECGKPMTSCQVAGEFTACQVVGHLDSGVDIDNEEEGQPIAVCTGPKKPWEALWPVLRHLS
jgi:hypothetical protein